MSTYKYRDIRQLKEAYSGNENPPLWILPDSTDDSGQAIEPTWIFIDNDGDIIIQVDVMHLKEIEKENIQHTNKEYQDAVTKILDLDKDHLINLIKNMMGDTPNSIQTILKY